MMAADYRHIGGGENRLGRHYSRFSRIWPTAFVGDQSLALRKSLNGGSNRRRRAKASTIKAGSDFLRSTAGNENGNKLSSVMAGVACCCTDRPQKPNTTPDQKFTLHLST